MGGAAGPGRRKGAVKGLRTALPAQGTRANAVSPGLLHADISASAGCGQWRHYDFFDYYPEADDAKTHPNAERDASGGHTCAMAMRLMVDNLLHEAASLGSPGLENVKWPKPVFPGDTLTMRQTILESRPMSTRPDVGLVRSLWEMVNQHGDKGLHMEGYGMFRRRQPAPALG